MNPFDEGANNALTVRPTSNNAVVDVETQRAMAEVQGAIILAKKFPRNQRESYDRILNACQREGLAKEAMYSYARGGSNITGPSIRLAESIAQNWGNLQFGIVEMEQRNGESTVKAYCWDVETNTKQEKVFQVPHTRHTRQGSKKLEDPRDIYELVANQGARRLRACILGMIPGDVIDAAVEQCEETLKAKVDLSPAAITKLVDAFGAYGVTKAQIEAKIQRRMEAIEPGQVIQMRKIYTSLKDNMSKPADWFEPDATDETKGKTTQKGASGLKERIKEKTNAAESELPMTPAEIKSAVPGNYELYQSVCLAITALADSCGDTPDDTIDRLTNGRLSALIDLEDKPDQYLKDIMMMVNAESEKLKEAA